MNSKKFSYGQDVPLGLSMAMAQNPLAYENFAKMDISQKQAVINSTHSLRSKAEMQQLVDSIAHDDMPPHNNFT